MDEVKTTRRQKVGLENSATRTALLDAAELLMREEGYAAVTSRRLGAKAGLKPQLVHYYFRTMDDLFLAVLRRISERGLQLAAKAMESDQPLRALWEQSRDPSGAAMNLEFMALANHRKVIRAEMARNGERLRRLQQDALARHFALRGIEPRIPPGVVTLLASSVGLVLVLEGAIGMSNAHAETEALVEACLRRFEEAGDAIPGFIAAPDAS
ncbi:TetR/AcrR family transcriptional regulator [Phenylobacterium sp. LjRoot225]|uniref:TetR/AcrR family transcriptional regulator n=1 Tax=Phenylobacterium sp. LjRoot225 TaxID=3342285 RepID=UPI003ECEDB47